MKQAIEEVIKFIDSRNQDETASSRITLFRVKKQLQKALDNSSKEVSVEWEKEFGERFGYCFLGQNVSERDVVNWIDRLVSKKAKTAIKMARGLNDKGEHYSINEILESIKTQHK